MNEDQKAKLQKAEEEVKQDYGRVMEWARAHPTVEGFVIGVVVGMIFMYWMLH